MRHSVGKYVLTMLLLIILTNSFTVLHTSQGFSVLLYIRLPLGTFSTATSLETFVRIPRPRAVPNMTMTATMPQYPEDSDTVDLGYFATTEEEGDDIDELAEPNYKYDIGIASRVFYPICIGEVLNERYRIDHKLGQGGFSTVWMAYDLQSKRDVALKSHGLRGLRRT